MIKSEKIQNYYNSIDGLRTISCLAIIAMHIKANTNYIIPGFLYGEFIDSLTWLVYLFMMISAFGMCAGYLKRFLANQIDLEAFYKKRYVKILPYFSFLILIALIIEPSVENFYEGSIEILLIYGLLPNNSMNVLGVCWTVGVIFLFYLLFPAFTLLMKSKKRAWTSFAASLWVNFLCENYFFGEKFVIQQFTPRHSFLYCTPLFISGGIIYLYRDEIGKIGKKSRWLLLSVCICITILYFTLPLKSELRTNFYLLLILYMFWLIYAVGVNSKFLGCKVMKYISSISMEMYLTQMVIFRLVEKCGLLYIFGNGWVGYITAFIMIITGLIIFIEGYKWLKKTINNVYFAHK